MSKVLVTYATGTGCTAGVAERIGRTLSAKGMSVDVRPVDSKPDPAPYDAVVAGSGIRIGAWQPKARKWVAGNAPGLKDKPVAFFSVCGTLMEEPEKTAEVRGYTDKLIAKTDVHPLDVGLFAGWYEPDKFNFMERKIMEMKKAPVGDFRDWEAIEAWADSVAPKLVAAPARD